MRVRHRAVAVLPIAIMLGGCSPTDIPTQSRPICSWAVSPPSNPDHLCTVGFGTLRTLAGAEMSGNDAAIRRLVKSKAVANKIIGFGRRLRAEHATGVHVVPSIILNITSSQLLGATSFVTGRAYGQNIREGFTLYMRVRGNSAKVVADDPGYAW